MENKVPQNDFSALCAELPLARKMLDGRYPTSNERALAFARQVVRRHEEIGPHDCIAHRYEED